MRGGYNPAMRTPVLSPLSRHATLGLRAVLAIALVATLSCRGERSPAAEAAASPTGPRLASEVPPGPPASGEAPHPGADKLLPYQSGRLPPAQEQARPPVVVFLGDSLTAGLGLSAEEAYPYLLQQRLAKDGLPIQAVNAGVSGDTSAGGLRRVSWLLRQRPDLLVVELGANDALRGQPIDGIESNLREVVRRGRAAGAGVLLLGLQVPPNLGHDYAAQFAAIYPRVARDLGVPLVPFMLAGVAGKPELNLPDGMHPNEEGHRIVAEVVRPYLEKALTQRQPPASFN
jgi:acyl-CoA thioesterase-1